MATVQLIPVSVNVKPCVVCGRGDTIRADLVRPHFPLPRPTASEQEAVYAYLAATPARATFCVYHLAELVPAAPRLGDFRVTNEALRSLWFAKYDQPTNRGHKTLWRQANRYALAPAAKKRSIRLRLSNLMRRFARRRAVRSIGARV